MNKIRLLFMKFFNKMYLILSKSKKLFYKLIYQITLKLGNNVNIDYGSKIQIIAGNVVIGDGTNLRSRKCGYHTGMPYPCTLFVDKKDAKILVGSNTNLNGCYIHSQKSISIGSNCLIASGVNIVDSNGHITNSSNRKIGRDIPKEITIGNNVWIAVNATILKGTSIGENSIVGAGSIVKGEYPPNSLIIGNPAKLVKKLDI